MPSDSTHHRVQPFGAPSATGAIHPRNRRNLPISTYIVITYLSSSRDAETLIEGQEGLNARDWKYIFSTLTNEFFVIEEVTGVGTESLQKKLVQRHESFCIVGHLPKHIAPDMVRVDFRTAARKCYRTAHPEKWPAKP